MMMRMLEAGGIEVLTDGRRRADSNNPNGYYELEAVKRLALDASWLDQARGKALKVVCFLLEHLPQDRLYHVVYLQRDLLEVSVSQRKMLVSQGKNPGGRPDSYWQRVLGMQEKRILDWMRSRSCFRILYLDYRQTLSYPAQVALQVQSFLDCGLDRDAMVQAVDAGLYRVRRGNPVLA